MRDEHLEALAEDLHALSLAGYSAADPIMARNFAEALAPTVEQIATETTA